MNRKSTPVKREDQVSDLIRCLHNSRLIEIFLWSDPFRSTLFFENNRSGAISCYEDENGKTIWIETGTGPFEVFLDESDVRRIDSYRADLPDYWPEKCLYAKTSFNVTRFQFVNQKATLFISLYSGTDDSGEVPH